MQIENLMLRHLRFTFSLLIASTILRAQPVPLDTLSWRFVGPWRAGRAITAVGIPGNPKVYYFGAVGGGIWKSSNAGWTWQPVFDSQPVASIGDLAVAPSNPDVIYAGTGETDIRSDLAIGDGVYRSTDGGRTWAYAGLRETLQIGRVVVDPRNPDTVWVAALGHAYGPNPERGVYRSTDGGRTWRHVLNLGPQNGAVDLVMKPGNARVLYAVSWGAQRTPWSQYAPLTLHGSEVFRSADGGETWARVASAGLPDVKDRGRAGIAAASDGRLFLLLEGKAGGLFRSDDEGASWTRLSSDARLVNRGWYFGNLTADPANPDRIYVPSVGLYRSVDGGRTFEVLKGAPGGDDYHSLWIDPADPARMISATDQGVTLTVDGGETWSPWYNQPTAQLYHAAVDNRFPYSVYGAQQDSGTVVMPSRSDHGVISEYDRRSVSGAEAGAIAVDPLNPDIVYVGNSYGALARYDRRTAQSQDITPWPSNAFGVDIAARKYRFPWTARLTFSPADPKVLYFGAQFLLRTTDGGLHWSEISPDLTGNARGVVYAIGPSRLDANLIWAGSDSGLLHVTRDGGKSWRNVTPPGLGEWSKIAWIEPSHFDAATAWVAVDRHRLDDYRPHLYRTRDFGKTWSAVTSGIASRAFLNAVREDTHRRGLLFAATEIGVYVSNNEGDSWFSLQRNLPVTSVRDLVVKDDDLVIATHGRGFWILDNFSLLRELSAEVAARPAHLFLPSRAWRITNDSFPGTPLPHETPQSKNPPNGAVIDYYLKTAGPVTLSIYDSGNRLVRKLTSNDPVAAARSARTVSPEWISPAARLPGNAGLNRFVWDLSWTAPGPLALPGKYTIRLETAGAALTQQLDVALDPRSTATPADLEAQFALARDAAAEIARLEALDRTPAAAQALADLRQVLTIARGADRRPPAQAYALLDAARKVTAGVMK